MEGNFAMDGYSSHLFVCPLLSKIIQNHRIKLVGELSARTKRRIIILYVKAGKLSMGRTRFPLFILITSLRWIEMFVQLLRNHHVWDSFFTLQSELNGITRSERRHLSSTNLSKLCATLLLFYSLNAPQTKSNCFTFNNSFPAWSAQTEEDIITLKT